MQVEEGSPQSAHTLSFFAPQELRGGTMIPVRLLPCSQPVFVYRPDRGAGGVTLSYDGYDFITARPCPCGGLRRRILRHIPARTDSAAAALVLTSCFIDTFCLIAIHEGASK